MRGKIRNRQRAQQLRDFTGLRFGRITPTDIDGYLEFKNTLFIFMEAKQEGAELPGGQRLALCRLVNAVQDAGKEAYLLVLLHDTVPEEDVDYAGLIVAKYWHKRKWETFQVHITCREAIEQLLGGVGLDWVIK